MNATSVYDKIRDTVHACLPGSRTLLFGSRARGNMDSRSDYDLLIITSQMFTPAEKIYWSNILDRAIVAAINAPVDILINSEEEVKQKQELPGHIVRSAIREGIAL